MPYPLFPSYVYVSDDERSPHPMRDFPPPSYGLYAHLVLLYRHYNVAYRCEKARHWHRQYRRRACLLFAMTGKTSPRACDGFHGLHVSFWAWHNPARSRSGMQRRTQGQHTLCAVSVHTLRQFWQVYRHKGVDFMILSPLFATQSASQRPLFPYFHAIRLSHVSQKPLIALGGITQKTARLLRPHRFYGYAGIDAFTRNKAYHPYPIRIKKSKP
ncbi:MAG: thiamine phosphate synthase [Alphaproteobacteria bacterium GM7ARS4]|nr:thiamine phosphate synthase [Alphaproteobacteria bacterium GM7ARS4]